MATDFATLQVMVLGWPENEANSPTGHWNRLGMIVEYSVY